MRGIRDKASPRCVRPLLAALLATALLGACGQSGSPAGAGSTTTASASSTTGGGAPEIVSFQIASQVPCPAGAASVAASATWSTRNVEAVDYEVDGEAPGAQAGLPASGSGNFKIPCDKPVHTVVFMASGADGKTVTKSATVKTQ